MDQQQQQQQQHYEEANIMEKMYGEAEHSMMCHSPRNNLLGQLELTILEV